MWSKPRLLKAGGRWETNIMKRFLVFTFDRWYPSGGWSDFAASYDALEEAQNHVFATHSDHYQIVDATTGQVIQSR